MIVATLHFLDGGRALEALGELSVYLPLIVLIVGVAYILLRKKPNGKDNK